MYKATNLQKQIFGATGNVYIHKPTVQSTTINNARALNLLIELTKNGYTVKNPEFLLTASVEYMDVIEEQIFGVLNSQTLQAYKLRASFGKSVDLERYTAEEWQVIFAQYSLTYGWAEHYHALTGNVAQTTIRNYAGKHDFTTICEVQTATPKNITIMNDADLYNYIFTIMEAKIPLRDQQILILKAAPVAALQQPANFAIKATEALVNNILYAAGEQPKIKSLDGLMRFILENGQAGNNGEDYTKQILAPSLKSFKFHLPTRMKKFIWSWLNAKAVYKHGKPLVEQMFSYEQWWKRCLHHAHFCSAAKFGVRFPKASDALTLLYAGDRSWTFNSRYGAAVQNNDYAAAINILAEKPGLMFRNLVMFCKYTNGVKLPVKAGTTTKALRKAVNTTDLLFGNTTPATPKSLVVTSDASIWLQSSLPQFLDDNKPTIKTLWQVIEELVDPKHEKPVHVRHVQGQVINYSTPIPAINQALRAVVIDVIKKHIRKVKKAENKSLGKVYLDPALKDISIQYSGAGSTELSASGSFLTQGSSIPIPANSNIIRLGCAWKNTGSGSCDIDLSTMAFTSSAQFGYCNFSSPQLQVGPDLIAVSSGDVTSCNTGQYSAEFIDIDIALAQKHNIEYFINYLNMYSGKTFNKYDTHVFISFIPRAQRIMPNNCITIDLAKQDYAVKLTDAATGYIGALLDVNAMTCQMLSISSLNDPQASTVRSSFTKFQQLIDNLPNRLKVYEVVKHCLKKSQVVDTPEEADITIGTSVDSTINVATNMEKFNELIF